MSSEFPTNPIELTQKLVRIPSDKDAGEIAIARYITNLTQENLPGNFRATLIPTKDPKRPSLIVANNELPSLVVISHYDTVPAWTVGSEQNQGQFDPFGGTVENGKLYGRGVADAKHTIGAMLAAASRFKGKEHELPGVAFVLPSDEEGGFLGSDALAIYYADLMQRNPGYKPTFVLSANGNNGEVSYGCRGLFDLNLEVAGLTGHSAIRKPGKPIPINAYDIGASAYLELKKVLASLNPTHLGKSTVNAAGGEYGLRQKDGSFTTSYNNVPDLYKAALEVRTNGGLYLPDIPINASNTLRFLNRLISDAGGTLKGSIKQERAAWLADRKDGAWFEEIIKEARGINKVPEWVYGQHGYDEIAIFMEVFNKGSQKLVPAAIYGVTDGDIFHKPDENVTLEDIRTMEQIILQTMISPELKRRTFSTPS
jgi:acetylornithine deacetylase/succinyl-diaminopimelate desuccinylase-like protein